jgi:hypothetical protein
MSSDVAQRLLAVRERIAGACRRTGRPEDSVLLVAVSKGQPEAAIRAAAAAGQTCFAENYAQELWHKALALADLGVQWHFVGGLQRNKAKKVVGLAALIQTVDDRALAEEIDRRAAARDIVQEVLVQVNVVREPQKSGVAPEALPDLLAAVAGLPHVRCRGLMAIPPEPDDPETSRPHFRALRALAATHGLPHLSMGMSADFEVAIEEGASLVRVGTAIFGPRDYE